MVSLSAIVLAAGGGLIVWTLVGWAVAGRLVTADLRLAIAPALGWGLQTVTAHALAPFLGVATAAAVSVAALLALGGPWRRGRGLPAWIVLLAAAAAVLPVLGLLPKGGDAALAAPIYDHAKIALIDEIVRTGVPPGNPFMAPGGGEGVVAYYYLWHFGAAQLALLSGASGWEADAAATWVTGFSALLLMCGLAARWAGPVAAAIAIVLVSAVSDSARTALGAVAGPDALDRVLAHGGLSNWLVQTSWSPQHVAAATEVVLAILVLERLSHVPSVTGALVLGLLAAAAYQSSVWVGGAAFLACAALAGGVLVLSAERRVPFLIQTGLAAAVAVVLVLPLVQAQLGWADARDSTTLAVAPFPVFGSAVGSAFDAVGYWLVLLPVDFPFLWLGALLALFGVVRVRTGAALPAAMLGSLAVAAWVASRSGENNDLGWRGILPALLVASPLAAAALARLVATRRPAAVLLTLALLLALPGGVAFVRRTAEGVRSVDAAAFAGAPAMWAAVRSHTPAGERVANDPRLAGTLTPWPVNISWALLSDRRSCYAGNELAIAFAPLADAAREDANRLFERVFAGTGSAADLARMLVDFGCRTVLLTAADGAFATDPFARSELFALAGEEPGRWRIYRAANAPNAAP